MDEQFVLVQFIKFVLNNIQEQTRDKCFDANLTAVQNFRSPLRNKICILQCVFFIFYKHKKF